MFISNLKPSQQDMEETDELVWRNNFLEPAPRSATATTAGFPPLLHHGFDNLDNHEWNKSVNNLKDFCGQMAQANSNNNNNNASATSIHNFHHNHNPHQFDPTSSTPHLDMGMDMDMMTPPSHFNMSFDSSTMSASCSPSVGATWSESSPEYETCRQQEANSSNSSFHRPSTTESSNPSTSNDAQSFSPTSDASWGSSPAPQQIQGSYMDLSDTTGTATTTATSHRSSSSMSAYPGQGQQNQQQQPADLPPHLSSFQGSVETDTSGLFNNAGSAPSQQQQQTANMSDFVVWPSSSQPSITSASPSFASHQQAEPRWHNLHQYSAVSAAEPMFDEPRFSSSSAFDNMSDGGMSSTNMPSSPINPFDATSHPSVLCDGLPSPTRSSFGRSVGGVSLQLQQQGQFPSVILNGGQLASGGVSFDGSGSNFSHTHHPSSSPSSGTIGCGGGGGGGGGDILFRGPISNRTVFDYPSSASGPTHFDQDMKAEGPLSVSPGSLWLNNSYQQHQHHKTPTPHPSPDSSPLGDHSFFHQNNQMPLPINFDVSNNAQFGNSHINTSQLHPHYVQQQQQKQQSRAQTQRKSLPHSPPHRMGGGGGRPPSPRYNPAVMATREMLPSHPNSPSMSMHWGHRQNQPHGLPHHHQLMMKPNTIPSHANHPQQGHLASMSHPRRSHQQPFHHTQQHGAHPYHPSSGPSSSSTKRRAQGGLPVTATDHLKRQRAEQDALLVRLRKQGKSYKQIAQIGRFTEAESTLRGRYRTLTKSREERVRKPEWTDKDLRLLEQAVRTLAKGPLSVTYSNPRTSSSTPSSSSSSTTGPTPGPAGEAMSITSLVSTSSAASKSKAKSSDPSTSASSPNTTTQSQSQPHQPSQQRGIPTTTTKIPWKQVAHYIFERGGSYKFGNATVRKRWEELMRSELAKGKDLHNDFWKQRSKRSPYHSLSQSRSASASSSFNSRAGSTRQAQVQAHGQARGSVSGPSSGEERGVRREAAATATTTTSTHMKSERDDGEGDGNLAYSDWLDMSALGDDAEEDNGNGNGNDGDGDYDVSDALDSEEEEEEEDDEDSDGDYMEE